MKVIFEKKIDPLYEKLAKRIFKSIKYKNNFWVVISDLVKINSKINNNNELCYVFYFECSTKCTNTNKKIILGTLEKLLPINYSESDQILIIYKALKEVILHEFSEEFKYNGQSVYNEHAPIHRLHTIAKSIDKEVKDYG